MNHKEDTFWEVSVHHTVIVNDTVILAKRQIFRRGVSKKITPENGM